MKTVPTKGIEEIAKAFVKMQSFVDQLPSSGNLTTNEAKRFIRGMIVEHNKLGIAINEAANPPEPELNEVKKIEQRFADPAPAVKLNLDDAVTVLRNISQGTETKMTVTHDELQSMVNAKINSLLSKHKKNSPLEPTDGGGGPGGSGSSKSGSRGKKGKKRSKPSENHKDDSNSGKKAFKRFRIEDVIPDAKDRCLDCGEFGHARGDPKCANSSFASRKIREYKEKHGSGSFLGLSSGSGTGNQA